MARPTRDELAREVDRLRCDLSLYADRLSVEEGDALRAEVAYWRERADTMRKVAGSLSRASRLHSEAFEHLLEAERLADEARKLRR